MICDERDVRAWAGRAYAAAGPDADMGRAVLALIDERDAQERELERWAELSAEPEHVGKRLACDESMIAELERACDDMHVPFTAHQLDEEPGQCVRAMAEQCNALGELMAELGYDPCSDDLVAELRTVFNL